ncbi:MAG: carbohydrate ABC transporter permease [Xylanivirga thermophila]|uniref:carbohydrate ABC transporter permease n=1 Tax=Xylanivirga thermophila TaxID=2496273 RepID=UPI00101B731B|nr:carbohydrate ABC transporter permease [Xylanivirga thermophila]
MNILKKTIYNILIYLVLIFTVVISIFPILWVIMSAFKTNAQILNSPFSLPTKFDFTPFVKVFTQYNFLNYTLNSLLIATVSTFVALLFFSMAAYVIAKYDFKGKTLFYVLFTMTLLVPGHTKAQPIFSLIMKMNLYDTKYGLILVYLSNGMAMSMFILKSAFMTIPIELNEAADIEGAGFWTKFWSINVPLAKSGLSTAGILMFLGNWNEYFYAMLLTSSQKHRTLPLALAFFTEAFSYDYTKMFAALTMVVLPGIIIYMLAQEQVQASVASSGVKG